MSNTKGQTLIIGSIAIIVILSVVITLVVNFILNQNKESSFKEFNQEASNVAELLLMQPFPIEWNITNIKRIGILDDGIIDDIMLCKYGNIDYSKTKLMLGLQGDYLFFFTDQDDELIRMYGWEYFGWNGRDERNGGSNLEDALDLIFESSENIGKDERLAVLNKGGRRKGVTLTTYVWDFAEGEVELGGGAIIGDECWGLVAG